MGWLSRHPALAGLASIALFVAGGGTMVFAIMALASNEPVGSVAIAVAAGAALLAASIALGVATERSLRAEEAHRLAALPGRLADLPSETGVARAKPRAAAAADELLGEWTLSADEWRAFHAQEADAKRRGAVEQGLVGAVIGAVMAWVFAGDWRYSLAGALLLGLAMLGGTLASAARLRRKTPSSGGAVVVRRNAVVIDGATEALRDDAWRLASAKLREDLLLPVLEVSLRRTRYERGGASRTHEDVVRVPVARGREADARRIARELAGRTVDEDDD
jgi:hypothetical protein